MFFPKVGDPVNPVRSRSRAPYEVCVRALEEADGDEDAAVKIASRWVVENERREWELALDREFLGLEIGDLDD